MNGENKEPSVGELASEFQRRAFPQGMFEEQAAQTRVAFLAGFTIALRRVKRAKGTGLDSLGLSMMLENTLAEAVQELAAGPARPLPEVRIVGPDGD